MYLQPEDLERGARGEHIAVVARNVENMNQAIVEAQAEVESYLTARYDIRAEFAKTGRGRLPMVVKLVRDIALYNCFCIASPVSMPESRVKAYDNAIRYLKEVQAERASIDGLTRLTGPTGTSSYVSFGGNRKRKNQY
jgi:phage gp36-like protein